MKIAHAIDAEHRRLSAALHDLCGPNLAAIALNLTSLERRLGACVDADLAAILAESRKLLSETTADLRHLVAELRPARLEYAGLVPALSEAIDRFRQRTGLEVEWTTRGEFHRAGAPVGKRQEAAASAVAAALHAAPGPADQPGGARRTGAARLTRDHEWLIYRVVQEALANCARHAAAVRVTVDLEHRGSALELRIADDGVGFDPRRLSERRTPPGLGLLTMRERVGEFKGRFELESRPGAGTRIRVRVPLRARAS